MGEICINIIKNSLDRVHQYLVFGVEIRVLIWLYLSLFKDGFFELGCYLQLLITVVGIISAWLIILERAIIKFDL